MARARSRNARGHGDKLRLDLLAAADRVLRETGDPRKVTVRGVAAAVGVAPNAVYLHFADRDELLAEVMIERFTAWGEVLREAVAAAGDDPLARLRAGHRAYCDYAREHPGHYRLMFGQAAVDSDRPDTRDRILVAAIAVFEIAIECCRGVVDAGLVGPVDPVELAKAMWAMEHGYADLVGTTRGVVLGSPDAVLDAVLLAARGRSATLG